MKSKEPPDALMLTTDAATVDKLNQDIGARMVTLLLDRSERRLPKEPQRICMQPTLVVHND
jgi:DNA-binding LacI/PurR family transcriptional regulator